MSNKKAQASEAITWIVATLIIIVALVVFLYFSSVLGKGKEIVTKDFKSEVEGNADLLNQKTSFAYELSNQNNKEIINNWRTAQNE